LRTAAGVPGFIGFAVGRTTFWDAMLDYRARRLSRDEAVGKIAVFYRERVDLFEQDAQALGLPTPHRDPRLSLRQPLRGVGTAPPRSS
jgi:hypothetical protein